MKLIILTIFTFCFSFTAFAAEVSSLAEKVKKGNEFYEQENYTAAQKEYSAAQIDAPDNSDVNYNQGDVFYKQKKYDKAIAAFKKALEYPTENIEVKCYYNIGNCHVQQGKLKEALKSYKHALKLDRDDKDIKYNIEYVQFKLKEIEKNKKKDKKKEEDPINKLLKELEHLIGVQAQNNVQTKKLVEVFTFGMTNRQEFTDSLTDIRTNEQNYVKKTFEIREGFKDLRTNLPPEKLYGKQQVQPGMQGAPGMQAPQQISLDERTRELINIYQILAESAAPLSMSNATRASIINKLSENEQLLNQIEASTSDSVNKQFSASGKDVISKIKYMLVSTKKTREAEAEKIFAEFNLLMEKIQEELNSRAQSQVGGMPGGMPGGMSNGTQKTLAQKIDNAVGFLATAHDNLGYAATFLEKNWTNAPPDQIEGLKYLIKARKEFDDKNKKNKKQDKKQNQKKDKKKDKQKKDEQQDQNKDEKNKDKKQKQNKNDPNKDKQKQDKQQDNKDKEQKGKQDKKQEKQQKLDKKQVKQMLKNFKEDQRNKRKMRMQKARAADYVPVDKDW